MTKRRVLWNLFIAVNIGVMAGRVAMAATHQWGDAIGMGSVLFGLSLKALWE